MATTTKLAEMDDKAAIASFTKLLLKHLTEGDDVTEQLHALNHMRTKAGMQPIEIPEGGFEKQQEAPKSEPRQHQEQEPSGEKTGPVMSLALNIPFDFTPLPDNTEWTNRFEIKSESSNRIYRIAQNKKKRFWGCNCPGWISRKKCKHLTALGLPGDYTPYEPKLKSGSMKKKAGKFKLYTGPTIVKQTADALRAAGINVTTEGTEHVHFIVDGDRDGVTLKLREILGPQWGVKGVQQLASKQSAYVGIDDLTSAGQATLGRIQRSQPELFTQYGADAVLETVYETTSHLGDLEEIGSSDVSIWVKQVVESLAKHGKKLAADMIHSDNDLSLKLEPASPKDVPPVVPGPEAGKSNDEMYANGHSENGEGGSPMYDGSLKSPERQNVNAIREALETQVEMEVGKPIQQKQEEVEKAEKVQDAALAQGAGAITGAPGAAGVSEVSAKPGTQIIINVASVKKTAYVKHCPGHKNSKGESAEWCIYSHETGKIISSEKSEGAAKKQLQNMHAHSGAIENEVFEECPECEHPLPHQGPYGCEVERGDAPGGEGDHGPYGSYALPPCGCLYGVDMQVKRSAEPIGGEPAMQPGVTSGHAGGMFGGTDLEGPSFHVGFTLKGYHREASFTSLAEADKFLNTASKKFGKQAGDWTMKCPQCGKTATKDKPQESYHCNHCGWNSNTKSSGLKKAEVTPHRPLTCYILDEMGGTEEAGHVNTTAEATQWFKERGINIYSDVESKDNGQDTTFIFRRTSSKIATDPAHRTLVLTLLKTGPKTTGEIEKALGGGKYTNKAYPILTEMAKDGIVAHKQMRWSLKQAKTGAATAEGWSNWETETVNLYITNDRKTYDQWWSMAQDAVKSGMKPEQLAQEYKTTFASKERQFIREQNEEQQADNVFTNVAPTNWLEIAMDAMQYVRNEEKAENINRDRREGPAEQRFEKMMEPGDDLHAKGMGISLSSLRTATIRVKVGGGIPQKGTPEWHQVQIAIKTLKMPDAMAGVMGGPNKEQSLQTLARYGLRWDEAAYMAGGKGLKKAGDGMAKTEIELEKEAGFNFFFPGQVLKEFYPEIQHEIVDYPNATNQSMSMENPEIVGDAGHELEGVLDEALDTNIVEMIQLPADVEGPFSMAASDYVSTSPAGGMGIGRDGKPEVLEGAPLRKENDIRGYMFTDEFYGQYEGIPGAAMAVASKTAAGGEAKQFAEFLNFVCGEIAATMVAAFKVTHRPLLDKIPGVGELQLDQIEQGSATMPTGVSTQGGRVKFLLEQLNDSEIKEAINAAWAQSAVWHDGGDGGFVYEVFVRPETIDTDSLKMKYKFVCGTKE